MNPYFPQLLAQVKAKAPRLAAEMAHYHHIQELDLTAAQREAALASWVFVECTTPPPPHPVEAGTLAMEYDLEIGKGSHLKVWLDDQHQLTDDPERAMRVPRHWNTDAQGRAHYRKLAYDGIRQAETLLRDLGVSRTTKIWNNIPT